MKKLVPYVADDRTEEALLNLEEMRMQFQTQLDAYSLEELYFDTQNEEDFDHLNMKINLRMIS